MGCSKEYQIPVNKRSRVKNKYRIVENFEKLSLYLDQTIIHVWPLLKALNYRSLQSPLCWRSTWTTTDVFLVSREWYMRVYLYSARCRLSPVPLVSGTSIYAPPWAIPSNLNDFNRVQPGVVSVNHNEMVRSRLFMDLKSRWLKSNGPRDYIFGSVHR